MIYAACLVVSLVILGIAVMHLIAGGSAATLRLPIGLPWVGANFRLDALAALFLAVVDLGAAGASLFALGYSRHEQSPARVLPFYPAFLGGMNLVILADDAFTFLVSGEFMSLSSWALVMAHHEAAENRRRVCVHHDGGFRHAGAGYLHLACLQAPTAITPLTGMADVVRL